MVMGVFRIPFFGLKRNNYKIDNYTRVHKKIFDLYHEYYGDMLHFIQYIDNIKNHEKVSFNVVGDTEVLPSKFSTKYESVIAFGIATEIDGEEKEMALLKLIEKYSPEFLQEGKLYISRAKDATSVMKISIEHMTGKAIK